MMLAHFFMYLIFAFLGSASCFTVLWMFLMLFGDTMCIQRIERRLRGSRLLLSGDVRYSTSTTIGHLGTRIIFRNRCREVRSRTYLGRGIAMLLAMQPSLYRTWRTCAPLSAHDTAREIQYQIQRRARARTSLLSRARIAFK